MAAAILAASVAGCDVRASEAKPSPAAPATAARAPQYLLDLADVHLKHGSHDEALALYLDAQKGAEPSALGRAAYGCGLAHYRKGDRKNALGYFRTALEHASSARKGDIALQMAQVYDESGDATGAESVLRDAMASSPPCREQLIKLSAKHGRAEALVRDFEERGTQDVEWLRLAARVASDVLRDPARACALLEKTCARQPGDSASAQSLLNLYMATKNFDGALALCERFRDARKDDRANVTYYSRMIAELWAQKGDPDRAVALLADLEAGAPDDASRLQVQASRFAILKAARKLAGEIERLAKAGDLKSLALIYTSVEPDDARALDVLRELLKQAPVDTSSLRQAAVIAARRTHHADAVAYCERAFAADARLRLELLDTYVASLAALGERPRAAAFLEQLAQATEARAACYEKLALLAQQDKQPERARDWAQKLVAHVKQVKNSAAWMRAIAVLKSLSLLDDALRLAQDGVAQSADALQHAQFTFETVDILEGARQFDRAEQLCRDLRKRRDLPENVRQSAERKLLELLHRQGKPAQFED
jgi:hypothetical protein